MKEGQTKQWPNEKGQITIYKILHRKLKIKQQETNRATLIIELNGKHFYNICR